MVSEAFALKHPTAETARPDFTATEILSGRTLYLAQDDTRSRGLNVYSLTAQLVGPDRLVVEIKNLTPVRFMLVTLFETHTLLSVHFIERIDRDLWGYYGLSAVRHGYVDGREKSFINRAAAFHRFLIGEPAAKEPPLAPR